MLKKFLLAFAMIFVMLGSAFAAVDLNTADQAALDSVKGIGAVKSKAILAERSKGGPFKDWADFEKRVKGFAAKSTATLSKNGVTINGQAKSEVVANVPAGASVNASVAAPAASVKAPAAASVTGVKASAPVAPAAKINTPAPTPTAKASPSAAAPAASTKSSAAASASTKK